MALVMREMQLKFDSDLPLQSAFAALGIRALPVAWVDDLAIPVASLHPNQLEGTIGRILASTIQVCASFGLLLNLKPHKLKLSWLLVALMPRLVDSLAFWIILPRFRFQIVLSLFAVFRNTNIWVYMFQADGGLQSEIRHHVAKAQLAHRQVRWTHHPHEQVHFSSSTASAFGGSDSAGAVAWCWKLGTADYIPQLHKLQVV